MTPEVHRLFHTLWTKAVGTAGYDKHEWQTMQRVLNGVSPDWTHGRGSQQAGGEPEAPVGNRAGSPQGI